MKFINQAKRYGTAVVTTGTAMVYSTASHAALTATDVQPVADEIVADAGIVFGIMILAVGTVLAMSIGIKLTKRFGNKI
ncbi:hypothetical protein [uncultured Methylophaga sp.]|uniref:hypothetical protein n=1 Tax=uncultured Methylophaga sp. TaxID=285271 RepID=UPI00261B6F66|nr:hypothetical protein [uncultured Methylophaga sp.]